MQSDQDGGNSLFLRGTRVLLVEDAGLLGFWASSVLEALQATVVGPIATVGDALRAIADHAPSVAVLDIDLHGEPVWPVARTLAERGIPFVFTTGFAERLPDEFKDRPKLDKPYKEEDLVAVTGALLADRPPSG